MYDYLKEEIAMIRLPSSEELNKSDLLQKFHINSHLTASINAGASILCTDNLSGGVCAAGIYGSVIPLKSTSRNTAIRPVIDIDRSIDLSKTTTDEYGVEIVELGSFPQKIADVDIQQKLESAYKNKALTPTGNSYTLDGGTKETDGFRAQKHNEYELEGKKYIRVKPKKDFEPLGIEKDKPIWVEVSPIEWQVDRQNGVLVSKSTLVAGVRLQDAERYISEHLTKEIFQNNPQSQQIHSQDPKRQLSSEERKARRQQRMGIKVTRKEMSVKDQMDFYIKNGMSFMLHGPSGVGKSSRVEAIDPDLTSVPLWNGVLPEDVIGKVIYPNGEVGLPGEGEKQGGVWVPPDWYVELKKKCEAEPDKPHVLFIDEVTNARETTQSLIFHITLHKSISPSSGKLPKNSVVVLAGNSKEESGAAYNMPEPLFRRMCGHIYLKPDIKDWIKWGSEKNKKYSEDDPERLNIHPIVSSFVATHGKDVFYTQYDEDEPKDWAMDPRGWEQVSDIIYNNGGEIREELLVSKMGPELAASFMEYAEHPPLALEDVLEGAYDHSDIPETFDAKLSLAMSLRYVNERDFETVHDFIETNLGKEITAVFDEAWVGKDDERALQVAEIKMQRDMMQGGRR